MPCFSHGIPKYMTLVPSSPDLSLCTFFLNVPLCTFFFFLPGPVKSTFITLYQKIAGLTREIWSFTNTKNVADKSGTSPSRLFTSGAERGFESTFSCLSSVGWLEIWSVSVSFEKGQGARYKRECVGGDEGVLRCEWWCVQILQQQAVKPYLSSPGKGFISPPCSKAPALPGVCGRPWGHLWLSPPWTGEYITNAAPIHISDLIRHTDIYLSKGNKAST